MLEQARVAAPRVVEALGLEVDVAGARPRPLGERRAGAVLDQRLPAVDGIAGAAEPQVAEAGLVERGGAVAMLRPATQERLVTGRGLLVLLLVEAGVRDV